MVFFFAVEEKQDCAARVFENKTKTFMTVPKCIIIDMMETRTDLRTIEAQIVQNLRTTRLGQNLLVFFKKACISLLPLIYLKRFTLSETENAKTLETVETFN